MLAPHASNRGSGRPRQTIGAGRPARQFAHDHTRAATHFDHLLAGPDRQLLEQAAHDADIARAAALLEACDATEMSAAESDRCLVRRQRREQRLPLPRRQFER